MTSPNESNALATGRLPIAVTSPDRPGAGAADFSLKIDALALRTSDVVKLFPEGFTYVKHVDAWRKGQKPIPAKAVQMIDTMYDDFVDLIDKTASELERQSNGNHLVIYVYNNAPQFLQERPELASISHRTHAAAMFHVAEALDAHVQYAPSTKQP